MGMWMNWNVLDPFRADLDPIYYCELIPACPVNDNGDAKFTSFTASPTSGPQGICDAWSIK